MTDIPPILDAIGLTKSVTGKELVSDINLALSPGEICAIIGPNGAGKTTLFKMLAGLTFPTSGMITFNGIRFDRSTQSGFHDFEFLVQHLNGDVDMAKQLPFICIGQRRIP